MENSQRSNSEARLGTVTEKSSMVHQFPPSTQSEMDQALETLQTHKDAWACLPITDRIRLLESLIESFGELGEEWVNISLTAKRSHGDAYATGMEWSGGPLAILRYLRRLHQALRDIEHSGKPKIVGPITWRTNGQIVVRTYPQNLYERLTTIGHTAEVWMEPEQTLEEFRREQAAIYRASQPMGRTALILGAGNVSGIPVNDSLSKLFIEKHVVLLKMNPVNEYLGPLVKKGSQRMIDQGFLQVVYGGATEGAYLCHHPNVDEIHMTGSDQSYEAIVFGRGIEGQRRKKQHQLVITKRFTAELGNVGPAIIVPGPWSAQDLRYQAEQIVAHLCDTNSYSCSRARVIVQHSGWELRQRFLDEIRNILKRVPSHPDYYPGSSAIYGRFISAHPDAERFGLSNEGKLPWALITGLHSKNESEIAFGTESFCPIITETTIDASSPADFVDRAVAFSNERLWGTLAASIVVHPRSLQDSAIASAVNRAIADLRYGTVSINCLPGINWLLATTPWGSYPGNPSWNIQSGTGFVHNAVMFSRPQKTVVRAPFRIYPLPIWFPSRVHSLASVLRKVVDYERKPSWRRLLAIVRAGLT